ncbi:S41 family peptidase [Oceanicaulis sp. LC35]|uniref:S41 family peptidase n=1 Tax=Oceanicaulis sp. LC35 TaxID=3349635 RepID=UPI003F84AF9F
MIKPLHACAPLILSGAFVFSASALAQTPDFRADAEHLLELIDEKYAYFARFDGRNPARGAQGVDPDAVTDASSLLRFAECAINALQDHHAILGISSRSSYGLTPSYNDLWVEHRDGAYVITDVRDGSPAQAAGVEPGWRLSSVAGQSMDEAVAGLCGGSYEADAAKGYAARVLAAGPRDQTREFVFTDASGQEQALSLPNLYQVETPERPLISVSDHDGIRVLRFNNSLGEQGLIAAIDEALSGARPDGLVIDLRDTPSGGDTLYARALMGRLIDETQPYQRHAFPQIERDTGVARQWMEEVLPRGESLAGVPVVVISGRWTGSMGEGLTIGLDAVADAVTLGAPMAGLLGAIYDYDLPETGWTVKLPTEALYHVNGTPREAYESDIVLESADLRGPNGEDLALERALSLLR